MTHFYRPPRAKGPRQPDYRWGLVRTKPGHEAIAQLNVERQGLKTFLPKAREPGRAALSPLFPGYLFVLIGDRWSFLKGTRGVVHLLMDGQHPARVPREVVQRLKAEQGKQGYIDLRDASDLQPGDVVRVERGTFVSGKAVYISTAPHDRVRLLIDFMGKKVRVEADRADIRQAGDKPGE